MEKEKIAVKIKKDGQIEAETFNFKGVGCLEELDKLLRGLGNTKEDNKKDDFFKAKITEEEKIHVKNQ